MENKPTYEELQAQVEALRKALNDQLNDCINFDGGKLTDAIMNHSSDLLAATPQQHLAEVKVQAGRDGFIAGYMLCNDGSPLIKHNYEGFADRYADSIRQGEVK